MFIYSIYICYIYNIYNSIYINKKIYIYNKNKHFIIISYYYII